MIKKLFIILVFCTLFFACGKKGDPVYKEKDSKIFNTKPNRV